MFAGIQRKRAQEPLRANAACEKCCSLMGKEVTLFRQRQGLVSFLLNSFGVGNNEDTESQS